MTPFGQNKFPKSQNCCTQLAVPPFQEHPALLHLHSTVFLVPCILTSGVRQDLKHFDPLVRSSLDLSQFQMTPSTKSFSLTGKLSYVHTSVRAAVVASVVVDDTVVDVVVEVVDVVVLVVELVVLVVVAAAQFS